MAYKGYINEEVQKMYGIPYHKLTPEQKKILHADSVRRSKLIQERQQAVLKNNLKAFEDEAKMERVLTSIYKDCQKQILADVTETIAKVKKAGGTWSYANQSALTRSKGLFEQITAELTKLGQKEQILFTQGLSNIYTDQFLRQVFELGQTMTVKANFNRLNPALIKKTLDYPWSGAMFSDRLWLDKETLGRNLRVGLTQSMILGEGIPEITDRITKNIETSRYNAERIARTETKRVTYCAHNDAYEDMGVEELEYHTAGERSGSAVCDTCNGDRGKHFKRGTEPSLPRHPNCKCVYIPVVPDTFGDNELNELTGSVRGAENYEKWVEANKDKINPDGTLKDGWERDWKNGGKLVNKNAPTIDTSHQKEIDEALEFYVSGEGMYINSHLAGTFEKNGGVWTKEDEKILKLLDEGTNDLVTERKLYRSVDASAVFGNMSDEDFWDLQDYLAYGESSVPKSKIAKLKGIANVDGKEITEPRFMSTTKDKDVALDWGGFTGSSKPIVLEFDVPDGIKGVDLARFDIVGDEQKEVLLKRGTKYKIKEITTENGSIVVKADLIPQNISLKDAKDLIPEVDPKGEVFTGSLGKSIRSSFDGNSVTGYGYSWGDYEEKQLKELYEQRALLTDPKQIKQVDNIIKNHEDFRDIVSRKDVVVEVGKAGEFSLKVPPSQSVHENIRNSEYYNRYSLVQTSYRKYNYDVYEERLGGKYYVSITGVSSKKERQEIYDIADKVFSKNSRAVGAKLRIDTVECNKHNTWKSTNLGFYEPNKHRLTVRNFKSYADIYGVDIQGGKDKFAGTLSHEFAHIVHSKDARLSTVTATAEQWSKWKDLVDPYYEQYRVNKIVDVGSDWSRMRYPINAEDHYMGGGKDHFYQEMWAECTAIVQEDVPQAKKADELAKLNKYFPKVENFITEFYNGGI